MKVELTVHVPPPASSTSGAASRGRIKIVALSGATHILDTSQAVWLATSLLEAADQLTK
jgi:hypothetical protein